MESVIASERLISRRGITHCTEPLAVASGSCHTTSGNRLRRTTPAFDWLAKSQTCRRVGHQADAGLGLRQHSPGTLGVGESLKLKEQKPTSSLGPRASRPPPRAPARREVGVTTNLERLGHSTPNETHTPRRSDEAGVVDVVSRLFLHHYTFDVLDDFFPGCAGANDVA